MYTNMLGFIAMNQHTENIQENMQTPGLDGIYSGHVCHPTNASSLECARIEPRISSTITTTTQSANMYRADIQDWVEKTPILPYEYHDAYANTVSINYCCEVMHARILLCMELL